MASLINIECKRYGCIKNLLACYANCRYSGKCDDLKNEILDKTDQAASDISSYLGERGRKPVMIQIMKRGVKFTDIANLKNVIPARAERKEPIRPKRKKSRKRAKPKSSQTFSAVESSVINIKKARAASYLEKAPASSTQKPARKRKKGAKIRNPVITKRESIHMPKRAINKSIESPVEKESVSNVTPSLSSTPANTKSKPRRKGSAKSRSAPRNGKVYIILEGKTANIVDEQGLMQHLFASPSASARYFEASEVEARVHIVIKK